MQYSLPVNIGEKEEFQKNEPTIDDELDFFTNDMAGTDGTSPFIKDEPDDLNYPHQIPPTNYGMNMNHQYNQHGQHQNGMNPPNMNYLQFGLDGQNALPGSYNMGNSGIGDDELADLDLLDQQSMGAYPAAKNANQYANQAQQNAQRVNNQNNYSSTPDGAPIQSPFMNSGFTYAGFTNMQQAMAHASPQLRPTSGHPFNNARHMSHTMNRQASDTRSPLTPRTPGMLHLETPQSGSLPSQPITYNSERQKRTSGQWDSNPDSVRSHAETPISSPQYVANQLQVSEMLKSGKGASLPAKIGNPEDKRKRRRESHNLVERRRRDNINEKIQELSALVPQHRLEDEKLKKQNANNAALSPSLTATGMSPPQSTSMLGPGLSRRNISVGIPPEDKDKGPNKGDILNGSVSWTRDLMLALYQKIQQEDELVDHLASIGQAWPFQPTEDEKRMRTEILGAMQANNPATFQYSRRPGTGLRVPGHTNHAGDPLDATQMGTISPQSLSPAGQYNNDMNGVNDQPWGPSFKEEDEYAMQLN